MICLWTYVIVMQSNFICSPIIKFSHCVAQGGGGGVGQFFSANLLKGSINSHVLNCIVDFSKAYTLL